MLLQTMLLLVAAAGPPLGEPAPRFALPDGAGAMRSLRDFKGRNLLLVFHSWTPDLESAALRAAARGFAVAVVERSAGPAPAGIARLVDRDGTAAAAYAPGAAFVIDRDGVLRRKEAGTPDLDVLVKDWEAGRTVFISACARCHGEDGLSRDYHGIKPLGGAGNRLTREEILARVRAVPLSNNQYSVRAQVIDKQTLEALITYVAGL